MVWIGISLDVATELVVSVRRTLNAHRYSTNILEPVVVQPPAKESSLPGCKGIIISHKLVNLACNYFGQFGIQGLFH
jgi:hypothetical protein